MLTKLPDELIVDDSSLHARTARATINQHTLVPSEKIQRVVCQNQWTNSLRDGQSHETRTSPRTTFTEDRGGMGKGVYHHPGIWHAAGWSIEGRATFMNRDDDGPSGGWMHYRNSMSMFVDSRVQPATSNYTLSRLVEKCGRRIHHQSIPTTPAFPQNRKSAQD